MTNDKGITDPKALRALAHPVRWQLIDLIGHEGIATATRCAEILGESVASCSYHLGMLAKYGYIEEVPGRTGREKPAPDQRAAGTRIGGARLRGAARVRGRDRSVPRTRVRTDQAAVPP